MTDEKNNSKVVNPHDKVFREAYSNKENARSLLTNQLPGKVLDLMDLNTLEISKDSFIEKETGLQWLEVVVRYLASALDEDELAGVSGGQACLFDVIWGKVW